MSYAGPTRNRAAALAASAPAVAAEHPPATVRAPRSRAPEPAETDWRQVAIFGVGVALGLAVGAGAALLAAPRTGAETRAALRARVGRVRRSTSRRGRGAGGDLREA